MPTDTYKLDINMVVTDFPEALDLDAHSQAHLTTIMHHNPIQIST